MSVIVTENKFPLDTPRDDLERKVAMRLRDGALSCRIEEEADGFVIVTVLPGRDMRGDPHRRGDPGSRSLGGVGGSSHRGSRNCLARSALGEIRKQRGSRRDRRG